MPQEAFSAGDVRFESTFTMDERLFAEYVGARDRSLNRRDGLVLAVTCGVVLIAYVWGTVSVWTVTPWGIAVGAVIVAALAYSVALAATGFTLRWPRRSWNKTVRHYFARHGAGDDLEFRLRTSACLNECRACVLRDGRPAESIGKPYKRFSHVEQTEHLVVLVADRGDVGSLWQHMFDEDYAKKLEERADQEDMVFFKDALQGGTAPQLVEYLQRKL